MRTKILKSVQPKLVSSLTTNLITHLNPDVDSVLHGGWGNNTSCSLTRGTRNLQLSTDTDRRPQITMQSDGGTETSATNA
ncbi:hypothetical protein FOMPIDRAFT_1056723 [Fomitopsis schrenkii]|uniref:Uncharacterized protein n=1 Tax=Fomitopsis schrenkii TaxID=2126942 RepID=S8DHX3_FOMSC|nr:hypothetical protein FOMPIDRAFT_1056723 [Fomitopsis schrenkii]